MKTFKHITPQSRVFCGDDCLKSIPTELKHAHSKRTMIFCDPFLAKDSTILDVVKAEVGDSCVGVFTDIMPNSPLPTVLKAAEEVLRLQADTLVVIGGGSTVVTARAASVLATEGMNIRELCTAKNAEGKMVSPRLLKPKLPQLIIPTTPTTATIKCGAAVLDPDSNEMLPLFSPLNRAHSVFIYPELIKSTPSGLFVNAAMSTLACAVDGLLSKDSEPMSDALLIHSLRLLMDNLADYNNLDDEDMRCNLMLASILCGSGSDYTGFGISVVMGHAVCAHYPLNAGVINAIVLPYCLRFNRKAIKGMQKIAMALSIDPNEDGFQAMVYENTKKVLEQLHLPVRLRDAGMPEGEFPAVAATAMNDWYLQFNPLPVTASDLVKLIEEAW